LSEDFEGFRKFIAPRGGYIGSYEKDMYVFGCEENEENELIQFCNKRPLDLLKNYLNSIGTEKENWYSAYSAIYQEIFVDNNYSRKPFVNITLGMFDSDGEPINQGESEPNFKTGEYRVFHPYPNKIIESNEGNDFIEELLLVIFKTEEKKEIIKKFLAQTYLEYRTRARPTLISFGERGSGKTLFFEIFFKQIFPGISTELPSNFQNFNGFLKNTFISADETQSESVNLKTLGNLIKKWSGNSSISINEKNETAYNSPFAATMFIASNQKPLHLTELIKKENDNQFLVTYFEKDISSELQKLKEKHSISNIGKAVKERIGYYIETVLFHVYYKILDDRDKKDCRYGFPIPIDKGLLKLLEQSETNLDNNIHDLLKECLWNADQGETCDVEELVTIYREKGILATHLIRRAVVVHSFNGVTYNNIRTWLDKHGIKFSNTIIYLGKRYRAIRIENFDKLRPPEEKSD